VGNLVAPHAVEQLLPHWQAKFGVVVTFGVILGFARSIWRLIVPLCAIGFWVVALLSVTDTQLQKYLAPSRAESTHAAESPDSPPEAFVPSRRPSGSAVPESAYFPARRGGGTFDFIKGVKIPDFIRRLLP
jgi:hypothetical protein